MKTHSEAINVLMPSAVVYIVDHSKTSFTSLFGQNIEEKIDIFDVLPIKSFFELLPRIEKKPAS